MTTVDPSALVTHVTSAVDYLRISIGDTTEDWVGCSAIIRDPEVLADAVRRSTAERAGNAGADVALSLFVQGYAFRIATVAIVPWVLRGAVLDIDPARTQIRFGQGRPNAVNLLAPTAVADASVEVVHERLVEAHLAPFVETARSVMRIGRALLWGNVVASCVSAFGAAAGARPGGWADVGPLADRFLASGRDEVRRAGALATVGAERQWERRSCCLWYRTGAAMCSDCSLQRRAEVGA